jgi:uncharacterized protein (DUF2235 family)
MSKNIVLCSDGTGNSDIKERGSNVFKLYEAIDIQGYKRNAAVPVQVANYDDGVGTEDSLPLKILGGAFGLGVARNVRQLYTELVHVFEPGDRIFLFGFSRGAYTVRTLSGMIQYCGIVDRHKFPDEDVLNRQVKECWREFRRTFDRFVSKAQRRGEKPRHKRAQQHMQARTHASDTERRRRLFAVEHEELVPGGLVNIDFIGVWDTVCAVGTPFSELRDFLNYFVYPMRFSDLTPGDQVIRARHALAIDDERRTFWPELWNERAARAGQVNQVWFAGVHSNVGGGYSKQGMSLVTLDWMMAEAEAAGLHFIPEARNFVRHQQDVHDKLYNSRSGLAVYYRWQPRDIAALCHAHGIEKPRIHVSVFERIAQASAGYAPGNLPFNLEVVTTQDPVVPHWPAPSGLQAIAHSVSAAQPPTSGTATSLLASSKNTLLLGKVSYHAFLLATFFGLMWTTCSPNGLQLLSPYMNLIPFGDTVGKGLAWAHDHLSPVCPNWTWMEFAGMFLVSAGVAWSLSAAVDESLRRKYSRFWHALRDSFRRVLT